MWVSIITLVSTGLDYLEHKILNQFGSISSVLVLLALKFYIRKKEILSLEIVLLSIEKRLYFHQFSAHVK